jgi:hypothetical protein
MTRPKNKEQQALLQNLVWNEILVSEVVDEPHGVHAEEAAGQHRWGGQPHKALARGAEHTMDLFQDQNRINNRKFNLNMQVVSFYLAHTIGYRELSSSRSSGQIG